MGSPSRRIVRNWIDSDATKARASVLSQIVPRLSVVQMALSFFSSALRGDNSNEFLSTLEGSTS